MTSLDDGVAQRRLPLWFAVPEQFVEIDLAEASERRAERTLHQLAATMPHTTSEQRLHFLMLQQFVIDRMTGGGVVYAATVLAHNGDGDAAVGKDDGTAKPRLTSGQSTVSVEPIQGFGSQTLETVAGQLRREDLRRDAGFVELPAGRALAVVEDRTLTLTATVLGEPGEQAHLVRQLQLTLPFPGGRRIAIFALSTECLVDWDDYVDIMGGIARTISFTAPRAADGAGGCPDPAPSSIRRRLDG